MNSLFIGLGGAGTGALAELQKKLEEYDRTSGTNSVNNFLYIDTDKSVTNEYPFIKDGDFYTLGEGVIPDDVMDRINKKSNEKDPKVIRIKEWIDTYNPGLRAPHDLTTGAAGSRMLTRMAMWEKYDTGIKPMLKRKLNIPRVGTVQRIYVVSGTCGGTGCGSVIDILFMLHEISLASGIVLPKINLMLVMPEGYIENYKEDDPRKTNYPLNAYGLFAELNACLKDYWSNVRFKTNDAHEFVDQDGNPTTDPSRYVEIPNEITGKQWAKHSIVPMDDVLVQGLKFVPFNTAYMFDSHTGTTSIDYDVISERIASFIFSLEVGNTVRVGLDGVFSNVLIDSQINSAREDYVKAFNATGTFTIQTFEELRKRYVKDKFIYQMMVHGFVGKDDDFSEAKPKSGEIEQADIKLWEKLNKLISDYTIDAWRMIYSLYENADSQTLLDLLKKIENKSKDKDPAFGQIFDYLGSRSSVQENYDSLCESIRECVMERCGEWIVKYNIKHAVKLVDREDLCASRNYAHGISEMKKIVPKTTFFTPIVNLVAPIVNLVKGTKEDLDKLKDAFADYVKIIVNRYLSDEGVFDECRDMLTSILREIDIDNFEIRPNSKLKLVKWEDYFIKDLQNIPNDPTRAFTKDTATLLSGIYLSKSCDFPRKYAEIIRQRSDKKGPEMMYKEPAQGVMETDENSLLWYKERIIREIGFSEEFRPDVLKAGNVNYVFETIYKQIQKEANEIILTKDSLKEPIGDQLNSEKARAEVAQKLYNATETFLSEKTDATHPSKAIYLGHFEEDGAANLISQAIRAQPDYDQNKNTITNDPAGYWDDRYVKVFVDMNYSLKEYSFFEQYESFFKSYYASNRNNWARHMPFSSKKFWDCDKADIVALFNKGAEETRIQQTRDQLQWTVSEQFYAFGFIIVLLNEYYKKLLDLRASKAFLGKFCPFFKGKKQEKPLSYNSKNVATLTYSSDYMFNSARKEYRVDGEDGYVTINLGVKDIDRLVGDIKDKYHRYVQYWAKVIGEARQNQTISNEVDFYKTAYAKIFEIANTRGEGGIFKQLIEPYYNENTQTMGERDFFEEYMLWFSK